MIDRMKETELIERVELFFKLKTYTFIKNIYGKFFNGYIIKIEKDYLILHDDQLGEIPIIFKEIFEIDYSQKNKNKEEFK